jgi:hypothetical protein
MAPGQLSAVVGLLKIIVDPEAQRLARIPYEDELISEEEECAAAAARASFARGEKGTPHEEVLREYGLTMDDWERMGQMPLDEPFVPGQ